MAVLTLPRRLRHVTLDDYGAAAAPGHSATIIPFVRRAPQRNPVDAAALRLLETLIDMAIPHSQNHAELLLLRTRFGV